MTVCTSCGRWYYITELHICPNVAKIEAVYVEPSTWTRVNASTNYEPEIKECEKCAKGEDCNLGACCEGNCCRYGWTCPACFIVYGPHIDFCDCRMRVATRN